MKHVLLVFISISNVSCDQVCVGKTVIYKKRDVSIIFSI